MSDVFIRRGFVSAIRTKRNSASSLHTRTADEEYQLQYVELKRVDPDPRENGIAAKVAQASIPRSAPSERCFSESDHNT